MHLRGDDECGDPVLFDTEREAADWAAANIDADDAREYAIVDTEDIAAGFGEGERSVDDERAP